MKKYYFDKLLDPDSGTEYFLIIEQTFWNENRSWDDGGWSVDNLPPKFYELQESVFEYSGPYDEGRDALLAAGFQEHSMKVAGTYYDS